MNDRLNARLAALPSLDRLLQDPAVQGAITMYGRASVVEALRAVLAGQRALLRKSPLPFNQKTLVEKLLESLQARSEPSLRQVFNLTGTVLHTNLGRALLPAQAAQAAALALTQAVNLEYDLEGGERGERDSHVEALLCRLTGAEAATVVNNNAGAVFLALNTLARGKEVPVSRGELVEIGGAFRVPEIIESAGCRLREVGTTNRTHLKDYEKVARDAAAILRVHASNYAIVGFVAAPADADLARLAHRHKLPFLTDLGSGSLVDLRKWGLPAEPTPMQALRAGADLVMFSGDKLLGGPQAGIVVGRRKYVERLRRNPLKRALRLDKARIAALESVLRLYLDPERLAARLPTLRLLTRNPAEIRKSAEQLQSAVQAFAGSGFVVDVAPCSSQIGSGSLPVERLPSCALRIQVFEKRSHGRKKERQSILPLVQAFRALPIPVIGRVHGDAVWLDLRCLEDEEAFAQQLVGRSA